MKIALLVMDEQRIILDNMYAAMAAEFEQCDVYRLNSEQQRHLSNTLQNIDVDAYDRIVVMLRFKKLLRQVNTLRQLKALIFIDHDTCQNYYSGKYQGQFSAFYKKIPWAKVLVSGNVNAEKLQQEGIDAVYAPKGYDQALIRDLGSFRDIELAFVGSIKNKIYRQRQQYLEALQQHYPLNIIRTESGEPYNQMLNRIRFFVSADVGMGEYMIKNFEAMAAGCIVFAWRQGEEDQRMGFQDKENIMLYSSIEEFGEKLSWLRNNPEQGENIRAKGRHFVENHYSWQHSGKKVAACIMQPLRKRVKEKFLFFTRYGYKYD